MNGAQILKERVSRNWEQQEAAAKLRVSQPYLSLIEVGKRRVTEKLARRAVQVFKLPPTALPASREFLSSRTKTANLIVAQIAGLGYPKFSHLKKTKKVNPAVILLIALETDDIDSRVIEALPWLIFNFPEMDWVRVICDAKVTDAQNRLGFLLSLAFQAARRTKSESKTSLFKDLLGSLEKSRLMHNDSFRRESLTETEKEWLKKYRTKGACRWRMLSNLSAKHLIF